MSISTNDPSALSDGSQVQLNPSWVDYLPTFSASPMHQQQQLSVEKESSSSQRDKSNSQKHVQFTQASTSSGYQAATLTSSASSQHPNIFSVDFLRNDSSQAEMDSLEASASKLSHFVKSSTSGLFPSHSTGTSSRGRAEPAAQKASTVSSSKLRTGTGSSRQKSSTSSNRNSTGSSIPQSKQQQQKQTHREKQTMHNLQNSAQKQLIPPQGGYWSSASAVPFDDQRETINLSNSIFDINSVDYWNPSPYGTGTGPPVTAVSNAPSYGTSGTWYQQQPAPHQGAGRFWATPEGPNYPLYSLPPESHAPTNTVKYGRSYDQLDANVGGFSFQLKGGPGLRHTGSRTSKTQQQSSVPSSQAQPVPGGFHIANMLPEVSVATTPSAPQTNETRSSHRTHQGRPSENHPALEYFPMHQTNYPPYTQDLSIQTPWTQPPAHQQQGYSRQKQNSLNQGQFGSGSRRPRMLPPAYDSEQRNILGKQGSNAVAGFMPNFNFSG